MTAAPNLPLAGIKVLDLSRWIAGPFCTMLLADMGADVIKVERPGGEDVRGLEPRVGDESAYVLHYNRNKRGVTLNTRHPDGVAILERLVAWADVLVENYRPGTLAAMGLTAERLDELNPRLIVTSISGFGQSGPLRRQPLFNAVAEAMSGAMSLTGSPATGPTMSGTFVADHTAGLHAAFATMVALYHRDRSGEAQGVDVALFDGIFSVLGYPVTAALNGVAVPPPTGNRDPVTAPANVFRTREGRHVYIDAGNDAMFASLAGAMGAPALTEDPRFRTNPDRLANVEAVEAVVGEWSSGHTLAEVSQALETAGLPFGPVLGVDEAIGNPQLRHREMIVEVSGDAGEATRLPGVVAKLSKTPGRVRSAAPRAGQHTASVLAELCGLSPGQIKALDDQGVI
jgi:crotonobetainyl-CoA:carnitine CoA-transferase CaiB-like acyl-CoA transferase